MSLAFSEAPADRVVQRVGTSANVGFIYTDLTGTLEVDVVAYGTTTEVVSWHNAPIIVDLPSVKVAQANNVPCGGPYALRIRDAVSGTVTSSRAFYVGAVFVGLGQSGMSNMWAVSSSPPTPESQTKAFLSGSWGAPAGNGLIKLGNLLKASLGVPIGFVCSAIGGTSMLSYTSQSGLGYWLDLASGSPFAQFLSTMSASWTQGAEGLLLDQGEQDMTGAYGYLYPCGVQEFSKRARVSSGNGTTVSNKLFIVVTGNYPGQAAANVSSIRRGQIRAADFVDAPVISCCRYDLATSDGIHATAAENEVIAARINQAVKYAYALDTKAAIGPKITAASKSGTTVSVDVTHAAGATALVQASSGTPTGFRFTTDNFASTLTPTGFSITSGTRMQFTFATAPTAMDYGYGNIAFDTHVITDDVTLGGKGCPLQPTTDTVPIA